MLNRLLPPLRLSALPRTVGRRCGLAVCGIGSLLLFSGCAQQPPSQTSSIALSGKRLRVIMRFADPVNRAYHYYFLINYFTNQGASLGGGDQNAPGPVPVLGPFPSYGNGFATGSGGSAYGFTDFVKFEDNTYRLLHVVGDPTVSHFIDEGAPFSAVLPYSSNGDPHILQFDIDLSQIVVDANGASLDAATTVSKALAIKWLQVNIVATDIVPRGQSAVVSKQVDSLGNTLTQAGASSFLILDVSQFRTFTNQDAVGSAAFEPNADNDIYTSNGAAGELSLNLVDYSISVVKQ